MTMDSKNKKTVYMSKWAREDLARFFSEADVILMHIFKRTRKTLS